MIKSIDEVLSGAGTVGITGHVRPDGDCVGSTLALYNYIQENMPEVKVTLYLEKFEEHFNFIKGADSVIHQLEEPVKHDVFIVLDCGDPNRVANFVRPMIELADKTVCIDHHMCNNRFADYNHVLPDISSVSEVLFELLDETLISKNVAEALYTGIIHDTGVLKYQATTRRTMEIAGMLMEKGIDFTAIIDNTFFKKTYIQNILLGKALLSSKLHLDGKVISSYMSYEVIKENGASGTDLGGIIDQLRFTKGVEVAIFLYELPDKCIKGSLRSIDYVDVNAIANAFGGGGHIRAAGFTAANMSPDEVIERLIAEISKQV